MDQLHRRKRLWRNLYEPAIVKILYGVCGEGMGHATRSKVVIAYLISKGHQALVAASGRAFSFLSKHFSSVEIIGLELKYADGEVDVAGSASHNLQRMPGILAANSSVFTTIQRFAPDVAFTDFDSFAYFYAKANSIPVFSIDNIQMLNRCVHPQSIINGDVADFQAQQLVSMKLPGCNEYVITTFFYPPVKPEYASNTKLVPPILRDEILQAKPSIGSHVLVYQTAQGDTRLLDVLNEFPSQLFVVYGLRRDGIQENCVIKDFREKEFVDDLASAKAVLANGGMSTLGECLYLGKPVYSVPIRHQFEQIMNARYLEALGYGMMSRRFEARSLATFFANVPSFAENIRKAGQQNGNTILFGIVDRLLAPS